MSMYFLLIASSVSLALARPASAQSVPAAELAERTVELQSFPVTFEGFVLEPDGAAAVGAAVVSSAGGQAVTGWNGHYRFEAEVPLDAESVQLTAFAGDGKKELASTSVDLSTGSALAFVDPLLLAAGTACQPRWLPTFGAAPGTDDEVKAFVVWDDGSGPALYMGGAFTSVGGVAANHIARWDGSSWTALGAGLSGTVTTLAVHDGGNGPALYAGGQFPGVQQWDGSSWQGIGSSNKAALVVHDLGGGPRLIGGGGGSVQSWNGLNWVYLGGSFETWDEAIEADVPGEVYALAVYDDGHGPALYAGGRFDSPAYGIAKWNGTSWSPVGAVGIWVRAMTVFDDGGGPALYVGDYRGLYRWDGSTWSGVGGSANGNVNTLTVYDDGSGPALYAGGDFTSIGGVSASRIAKWNGSSWSALEDGMSASGTSSSVDALVTYDDGFGSALYAGGSFLAADHAPAMNVARWDGSRWRAPIRGKKETLNGGVHALEVFDDGTGPALFAGGLFTTTGNVVSNGIARWNGSWAPLASGASGRINALVAYDDGVKRRLFAGGQFYIPLIPFTSSIASWDGVKWKGPLPGVDGTVHCLALHNDGGGPALYVGGDFDQSSNPSVHDLAKWNGTSWSVVGSGVNGIVRALTAYDDGGGPALYAGGDFTIAGGVTGRRRIARWDGSSWSALGSGMNNSVKAVGVYDDGAGPALFAGGDFTLADGVSAQHVARWDGSSWSALGSGVNNVVNVLMVFDDGSGPALYAGGAFTTAGGVAASHVAKWNGSSWTPLASGVNDTVFALKAFDDGGLPALYVGGDFTSAPDSGDRFLAKWGCPFPVTLEERVRRR